MKSDYSFETSLPAHEEGISGKKIQAKLIIGVMKNLGGSATLKELEHALRNMNVALPQGTISGRIGDLRGAGKVDFYDQYKVYDGRKRKIFAIKTAETISTVSGTLKKNKNAIKQQQQNPAPVKKQAKKRSNITLPPNYNQASFFQ